MFVKCHWGIKHPRSTEEMIFCFPCLWDDEIEWHAVPSLYLRDTRHSRCKFSVTDHFTQDYYPKHIKLLLGNFIWEVKTESPFLILKADWVNSGRTHITAISASPWKPPSPAWTKATEPSMGQLPLCPALPLHPSCSPQLSGHPVRHM